MTIIFDGTQGITTPAETANNSVTTPVVKSSANLVFQSNGTTEVMRITSGGNVGIGTNNPTAPLDITGSSYGYINLDGGSSSGHGSFIRMRKGGTDIGYIGTSSAVLGNASSDLLLYADGSRNSVFWVNGQERMRIDSSGRVTTPFQPAFRAFRSSSVSVAASGVVVFDSTSTNIGSNYNTSNGRFTAPVAGMYQFAVQLLFEGLSNGDQCECSIYVNGGGVLNFGPRVKYQADYTGFNGYVSMFASISIYLNANDYVQAAQITSGARTVYGNGSGVWTVFSGFLQS